MLWEKLEVVVAFLLKPLAVFKGLVCIAWPLYRQQCSGSFGSRANGFISEGREKLGRESKTFLFKPGRELL